MIDSFSTWINQFETRSPRGVRFYQRIGIESAPSQGDSKARLFKPSKPQGFGCQVNDPRDGSGDS
jgi:hypothetical protein